MAQYYQNRSYSPNSDMAMGYGAASAAARRPGGTVFKRGLRTRLNVVPVLIAVFLPWILFDVVLGLCSSSARDDRPVMSYSILATLATLIFFLGMGALGRLQSKSSNPGAYEPSWVCTLFLLLLLAFFLALTAGETIHENSHQIVDSLKNLGTYHNINPSTTLGEAIMDAGVINFVNHTALDTTKAMSFSGLDTYCVAPIVLPGSNTSNYDFWAIGINCCDRGKTKNFHCGSMHSTGTPGGYRLMQNDYRALYRLAVQQAEATYGIHASHPLFFHWTQDPQGEVDSLAQWGNQWLLVGICAYFILNTSLVAACAMLFTKLGYYD